MSPDWPGFQFGSFLLARPANGIAVCLFQMTHDELLIVTFNSHGYELASSFVGIAAMTVTDSRHWALAGQLAEGERIVSGTLGDGEHLSIAACPTAWLSIVPPLQTDTQVSLHFRTDDGDRRETLVLSGSDDEIAERFGIAT